jgi:hypothetical protein
MVDISAEAPHQIERRLRSVIRQARVQIFDELYQFEEFSVAEFGTRFDKRALALVRDGELWSQLIPFRGGEGEAFGLFGFHFPPDQDNSGFVGWLASRLKAQFGSGVLVICGMNQADGGIYDYWGCPAAIAPQVFEHVLDLHRGGGT